MGGGVTLKIVMIKLSQVGVVLPIFTFGKENLMKECKMTIFCWENRPTGHGLFVNKVVPTEC